MQNTDSGGSEQTGTIQVNEKTGWFSYWQPHGDSELGMGIVVEPEYLSGYTKHLTDKKDESHLLVHMKPIGGKVVYYTGFGWKKSGRHTMEQEWNAYLEEYAALLSSPLEVSSK